MVRGVYRLTCDDPSLNYYGSSDNIYGREKSHKCNHKRLKDGKSTYYCSSFKLYDVGGVEVELVLECSDEISKLEMREIEQTYIDNDECCNIQGAIKTEENEKKYRETESRKQYIKLYNESNKAKEAKKNWCKSENGKEKRKEYMKLYNQSDKAKEAKIQYKLKQKTIE